MKYYFILINFPGFYKPDFPKDISEELKSNITKSANDCSGVWNVFYKTEVKEDQEYIEKTMIKPISGHVIITEKEYEKGIEDMKSLNNMRNRII